MHTGVLERPRRYCEPEWLNALIASLLVLYGLYQLGNAYVMATKYYDLNGFQFTEWLIDYEGGFVRRGLAGELLHAFCGVTGLWPPAVIVAVCVVCWLGVVLFFFREFHRKGCCWWLLFSPFFLGYTNDIIRKDYLSYLLIIGIFTLLRAGTEKGRRLLGATMLAVLGVFVHEAFIFYGCPLLLLALWRGKGNTAIRALCASLIFGSFALICLCKGDAAVAESVARSWDPLLGAGHVRADVPNSINALDWDALTTMRTHMGLNLGASEHYIGVFYQPLLLAGWFVLMSGFLRAFPLRWGREGRQRHLSALLLLSVLCLAPMFFGLSCDMIRLYQYATLSSFAAWLLLPPQMLEKILPSWLLRWSRRLDVAMERRVRPGKAVMLVLLFMLGSPYIFSVSGLVDSTIFYSLAQNTLHVADKIIGYIG